MDKQDIKDVSIRNRTFRFREVTYRDVWATRSENEKENVGDARLIARGVTEVKDGTETKLSVDAVLDMPVSIATALSREFASFNATTVDEQEKN